MAGALAAPAAHASAPLHCGATIKHSTILQGNTAAVSAPNGAVDRGA